MDHTIHWFHIDLAAEDVLAPLRMKVSLHGLDPPLNKSVHRILIPFFHLRDCIQETLISDGLFSIYQAMW